MINTNINNDPYNTYDNNNKILMLDYKVELMVIRKI